MSRWLFRFPWLSAITIGIIAPLAFGYLAVKSCPHESGLFWLPLVSAECPGEFLGELGFLITTTPGLVALLGVMFLASSVPPLGNFLDNLLPAEVTMSILCLVPNLSVWLLIFTIIRRRILQNKNEGVRLSEN